MKNFKIPNLANNPPMPHYVTAKLAQEEIEAEQRKKQFKHDWRIAIFSCVGGGVMGLATSVIFWLLTTR